MFLDLCPGIRVRDVVTTLKKPNHTYKYYLHPFCGRKHVVAKPAGSGAFAPQNEIIVSRVQFNY